MRRPHRRQIDTVGKFFSADPARPGQKPETGLVANLETTDDTVTVKLTGAEKLEAVHGDLTVPRAAVTSVRAVPDGMAEVHGLRMPGAGIPGVIMVGTFRSPEATTFAVCHGEKPAVVIELSGERYDKIVVTVDNPEDAVSALS
jgi:hypothetical protein